MNIINLIKNFKYIILINILIFFTGFIIDYNNYTVKKDEFAKSGGNYIFFFEVNVDSQFLKNYDIFVEKPIADKIYYIQKAEIIALINSLISDYIDEFIISYGDESFSKIEHSNHYDLGYSYILKYRDKSDNFDFSNKLLKDAQESDVEQLIIQFINDAQNTFYKAIDRNLAINKYLIEIGIDKPMIINFKNYSVKQPYNELPVNAPITIVLLLLLALFNLVYFINANENK